MGGALLSRTVIELQLNQNTFIIRTQQNQFDNRHLAFYGKRVAFKLP